jgi:hypothetical protein
MSKTEDRKILSAAKKAGEQYALNQIEGDYFSNFVAEQVYAAVKDPDAHFETLSKSGAMRAAKNILVDLGHDISRDLDAMHTLKSAGISNFRSGVSDRDLHDAFWEGIHTVLDRKNTQSWLADEIQFRTKEAKGLE